VSSLARTYCIRRARVQRVVPLLDWVASALIVLMWLYRPTTGFHPIGVEILSRPQPHPALAEGESASPTVRVGKMARQSYLTPRTATHRLWRIQTICPSRLLDGEGPLRNERGIIAASVGSRPLP
jgi:hypothetical protein